LPGIVGKRSKGLHRPRRTENPAVLMDFTPETLPKFADNSGMNTTGVYNMTHNMTYGHGQG